MANVTITRTGGVCLQLYTKEGSDEIRWAEMKYHDDLDIDPDLAAAIADRDPEESSFSQ